MGFGYPLATAPRYELLGQSAGAGTTVTGSATANTKGSYTTIGTSGFDYDGCWLYITNKMSGTVARYRVDLAVNNGGSDQIIVADMFYDGSTGGAYYSGAGPTSPFIPVRIFKGATVKARCQATAASGTVDVSLQGVQGGATMIGPGRGLVNDTPFTNTDPTNGIVVSGTTQTAWTQIVASTTARYRALYVMAGAAGGTVNLMATRLDIGWGSSGNERTLFSLDTWEYGNTSIGLLGGALGPYPCNFAVGTRLALRIQSAYPSASGTVYPILYGLLA